ncbi:LysR family transcriptional regulator [Burkholderia pyrrocinia]|uniref:LysR family transcriptional regulator n=1 Tax=Burkholderia pyrrocinia TaxID=60550 RepID=UPI001FC8B3DA|nr:LysR family transcriptional regulator [Burkholderia pyrrocinia]
MTQSAVAQQIRVLETFFGQKLLERNGRSLRLTPRAQHYLVDIASCLERLAQATEDAVHRLHSAIAAPLLGILHRFRRYARELRHFRAGQPHRAFEMTDGFLQRPFGMRKNVLDRLPPQCQLIGKRERIVALVHRIFGRIRVGPFRRQAVQCPAAGACARPLGSRPNRLFRWKSIQIMSVHPYDPYRNPPK